jgi:hypothetical protein
VTKPRHREIENVTNFTAPERSLVTWVRTMRSRSVYEGVPPPRSPTTWTAPAAVKIRRSPVDQLLSPRAQSLAAPSRRFGACPNPVLRVIGDRFGSRDDLVRAVMHPTMEKLDAERVALLDHLQTIGGAGLSPKQSRW